MNENNNNLKNLRDTDDDAGGIDALELLGVLARKIWLIILCFIVGAAGALAGTLVFITPQYKATSMIYVYSSTTSITSLTDLQISDKLTGDFTIVATTREVIESVIDELDLDTTYEDLADTITISNPDSTHILQIAVTNPDPELAAEISNALADALRETIATIMNTDMPAVVTRAVIPTEASSPSIKTNAVIGGFLLAVLAAAIVVAQYMLDDTIKTQQDVEKYLGLNTLAAIPEERAQKARS